ncbi:hypothetical protein Poli38472_005993 [Pythium oligandrum]|uniref:Ethylmalonyl-CoA decarboxylase n=1 Tax=Pythium oligandrum TaxID=41045 RepID=A0A8K1CTR9_PYTOL|nr:hypothetical protein Poli38472_005993 [Pythium oligandrum]|eukprot:TMW68525.1 hypothetical protein Poli38472_005993 [Pythium oligandrum]
MRAAQWGRNVRHGVAIQTSRYANGGRTRGYGLFSFVNELADDQERLVAKSKEVLRGLGRPDDENHVRLFLPGSTDASVQSKSILSALSQTAVIEVHNPRGRNALSGSMMAELADVVTILEDPAVQDKLSAVVLRGTAGWFCAGADLRVAKTELNSREGGTAMGALMMDTLTRFRRLPLVSVALIEGGAYGGGAELSTSCDFRVVADNAIIQFVQAKMGISPGWGGGTRLYKILGRQHALRLLCTAQKIKAADALSLGLADETFAYDGVKSADEAVVKFLQPFDSVTPEVSHGAKDVITAADDVSLDEVLEFEHRIFKTLWGGPANLKALENALGKK